MKILILVLLLATAATAFGQAASDCSELKARLEDIQASAAQQMAAMVAVAVALEGVDPAVLSRAAGRLGNPLALALAGRDGGNITQATVALIRAKQAALAAAGCPAGTGSNEKGSTPQGGEYPSAPPTEAPVPCAVEGQPRPTIGMTLARAKQCFGEFTLKQQFTARGELYEEWEHAKGAGTITVKDGVIIDWQSY